MVREIVDIKNYAKLCYFSPADRRNGGRNRQPRKAPISLKELDGNQNIQFTFLKNNKYFYFS